MEIKRINESDFRDLVLKLHKDGHFKGDAHRMQANFKTNKNSTEFISIVFEEDGDPIAFCGLDIYKNSKNETLGMIHCQGVIKEHRGKGLSVDLLHEIEKFAPDDLTKILSICNPISCKAHERAGYIITNPGRRTSTGKLSQIRLAKDIKRGL